MTEFRMIGAAALSLMLAGPAMAASTGGHGMNRIYHEHYGRVMHRMPAQDLDQFDLGIARPSYHPGWGNPYGDGVDDNPRVPPSANGG